MPMWTRGKEADWRDAVCRIGTSESPTRYGTGFPFAREGDRTYLLTCRHVLDALGDLSKAWVRPWRAKHSNRIGVPFEVVAAGEGSLDLAVIAVKGWADETVLQLLPDTDRNTPFEIFGAGAKADKDPTPVARRLCGTLGEDVSFDAPDGAAVSGWEILIDNDSDFSRLKRGYSGAPVWDPEAQAVAAIVTTRWGEDKGYAIAVDNVVTVYPQAERFFDGSTAHRGEYQRLPDHWVLKTLDHHRQIPAVERCWNQRHGDAPQDRLACWFEAGTSDWHQALPLHLYLRLERAALRRCGGGDERCEGAVIECSVNRYGPDAVAASLRLRLDPESQHLERRDGEVAEDLLLDRIRGQPLVVLHLLLADQGDPWGHREILRGGLRWIQDLKLPANSRLLVLFCCLSGEKPSAWRSLKRRFLFRGLGHCLRLPRLEPLTRVHVDSWLGSEHAPSIESIFNKTQLHDELYDLIPDRKQRSYEEVRRKLNDLLSTQDGPPHRA